MELIIDATLASNKALLEQAVQIVQKLRSEMSYPTLHDADVAARLFKKIETRLSTTLGKESEQ